MDYQVKALKGKEIVLLSISAMREEDALSQAQARGYTPISASATNHSLNNRSANKKFPLILFAQELHALLEAGLNLVEAIETLADKDDRNQANAALVAMLQSL